MALRYSNALIDTRLAAVVTAAGNGAVLQMYAGATPAKGATPAGTLLAELTCGSTLGTVSNGVLTLNAITGDSSANADGTGTYWRLMQGATFVVDGSLGIVGSGADIEMNSVSFTTGVSVDVTSMTITGGNN